MVKIDYLSRYKKNFEHPLTESADRRSEQT